MTKWSITAAVLWILLCAGCNASKPIPPAEVVLVPAESTPPADPQWLEVEINRVHLGIWQPAGWITDFQEGLILAEHDTSFQTGDALISGMMVYIFVPPLDTFEIPAELSDDRNMAWMVLSQAITRPTIIGAAAVTDPQPFIWGAHDAAYYLLTNPDGMQTVVIGVALPDRQLLVVSVMAPPDYEANSGGVREAITSLLEGVTINGAALPNGDLTALPETFVFPPIPAEGS